MDKRYLYQFYWDCGRMGNLEGLFIATEAEIKESIGSYLYFGEVLGKHSEIFGTLDEEDVEKLNVTSEAVEEIAKILGETWSGFNPLEYIKCKECGENVNYCSCNLG